MNNNNTTPDEKLTLEQRADGQWDICLDDLIVDGPFKTKAEAVRIKREIQEDLQDVHQDLREIQQDLRDS